MTRILSQCSKELAQFRRDRLTLALAFVLPLMALFIFGFAIRLEAKDIPLVVQDLDRTILSRSYQDRLYATNQFRAVFPVPGTSPQHALDGGLAKAVVIVPPEFSRYIKAGKPTEIQVLVDGTDANNARVIKNSIKATTNAFMRAEKLLPETSIITPHTRIWFNPGRQETLYIVPGAFGVVLWIFPSLLAAIAMVREKEKGTILQVYASSMSSAELLLGKALAYFFVALAMALSVIGIGVIFFGLQFVGDPTPFLIGTPLFLWTSVMFGLLIGVRVHEQNAAVQAVGLVGFVTALLLSGFIYPLSNIPFPLSLITNFIPARYYISITRDAFVRGTGWAGVWWAPIMIFVIGMLFFNISRKVLGRMQVKN